MMLASPSPSGERLLVGEGEEDEGVWGRNQTGLFLGKYATLRYSVLRNAGGTIKPDDGVLL